MSDKRPRLAPEDDAVWDALTKGVKPLTARRARLPVPEPLGPPPSAAIQPRKPPAPDKRTIRPQPRPLEPATPRLPSRRGPPSIEDRVLKAIRRGQTPIDMRLDLHGETQIRAHKRLEQVLATGRVRGARVVLVVTGTGMRRALLEDAPAARAAGEDAPGVLRRMLPVWLSTPPLSDWVIGLSQAAQNHGGAGAFYILLRRQRTV